MITKSKSCSLWELMEHFDAASLMGDLGLLSQLIDTLRVLKRRSGGGSAVPPDILQVTIEQVNQWVLLLMRIKFKSAAHTLMTLQGKMDDMDVSTLKVHMESIHAEISKELFRRRFVQIPPDLSKYVEDAPLELGHLNALWPGFRRECSEAFPSAVYDIREAGNCLAVGCDTAAVFHLMRIAERGLRVLAWDRRVKIPKGPIEFATWEDIIRELEKAEAAIIQYPKGVAREAQLNFYHGAMMELRAFKNARNQVMHTRSVHTSKDALAIYEHVEKFMFILAGRISEKKRKPLIWKRA